MDSIVALDIETTGLDADKDAIIEIGAVKFKDHRIEDEFQTLIHPGRRIPPFITNLTGISDQMVLQAPAIQDVLPSLAEFVGRAPVLGQNVRFDLGFLRRQGVLRTNPMLDTYDMAGVLLPGAGRYNLSALTQILGVLTPATHRALDDARATMGVFLRLMDEAANLPLPLLAEIVRQGERLDWGGFYGFQLALRARSREIIHADSLKLAKLGPIFARPARGDFEPLEARETPLPMDIEEMASILEPGGLFAHQFPHFEHRSQQVEMLRAVGDAFNEGRHLMVEAGTGTGKSMAYLIPAAIWALQNGRRVVISTNTINLQDQLINKDIPDLRQALGVDVNALVLKGRANYICPRRLESLLKRGPETAEEMRVLGKVLVWLQSTQTGDRAEINLNGPVERAVWSRLSADDEGCSSDNCLRTGGICPFYRVRQAAQSAHILVVNHALLLSDVATGSRVLPEYDYLIVDEAHHLEDATTNALSFQITHFDLERLMRALGGATSGTIGALLTAAQETFHPQVYGALAHSAERSTDYAIQFQEYAQAFFIFIDQFIKQQRDSGANSQYAYQERIIEATRSQPAWEAVESAWEEAETSLKQLLSHIEAIIGLLNDVADQLEDSVRELASNLISLYRRLSEINDNLEAMIFSPRAEMIYWVENTANGSRPSLHAAPLHIGHLMEQHLWRAKVTVVLTSATLTATNEFNYIKGRLNASMADELALGSPFDYETAALLYLVNDIPEPSDRSGHQRAIENGLIQLATAAGGRTLALFTSYEQLKRTSQAIAHRLAKEEIQIYEQGEGASAHALLEAFRGNPRAVLLGTRAFWEGVDIPGDALSVLAICKLPFDVPSDPIIAARSETFEDPFSQYSLPEAILRFRQGFGRLIRTQFDHGVVAIFDRRLLSKRYGKMFLDSLPVCTVKVGPLQDLPRITQQWLNL